MFIGCSDIFFCGVLLQMFLPTIIGLPVFFLTDLYEFFIFWIHKHYRDKKEKESGLLEEGGVICSTRGKGQLAFDISQEVSPSMI